MNEEVDYTWECPERSRSNVVAGTLVAMAVLLTANFVATSAGLRWGFTWPVGEREVFIPWLAVIAAVVPVAFAVALRAVHFVAVLALGIALLVVAPALIAGLLPAG